MPFFKKRKKAELEEAKELDQALNASSSETLIVVAPAKPAPAPAPAPKLPKPKLPLPTSKRKTASPGRKRDEDSASGPSWKVSSWLSSLQLLHILSDALLQNDEEGQRESETIKSLSEKDVSRAFDDAAAEMKKNLIEAHK